MDREKTHLEEEEEEEVGAGVGGPQFYMDSQ